MGSSIYFHHSVDRDLHEFIWSAVGVEVFMLVFLNCNQIYDLSTGMFVAFGLGLLARGKFNVFYTLFPVSCLNRETMILLTIVFGIFYFWKLGWIRYLSGMLYQAATFAGIRTWLTALYADNSGQDVYFWPARVLGDYLNQLPLTMVLICLCILIAWRIVRSWNYQPDLLRCALLVMLPILIISHLTVGMAFELRVFAEVFPVVWVLCCNIFVTARRKESFSTVL